MNTKKINGPWSLQQRKKKSHSWDILVMYSLRK